MCTEVFLTIWTFNRSESVDWMYADSLVCDSTFALAAPISENDNLRPFTLSNYDLKIFGFLIRSVQRSPDSTLQVHYQKEQHVKC